MSLDDPSAVSLEQGGRSPRRSPLGTLQGRQHPAGLSCHLPNPPMKTPNLSYFSPWQREHKPNFTHTWQSPSVRTLAGCSRGFQAVQPHQMCAPSSRSSWDFSSFYLISITQPEQRQPPRGHHHELQADTWGGGAERGGAPSGGVAWRRGLGLLNGGVALRNGRGFRLWAWPSVSGRGFVLPQGRQCCGGAGLLGSMEADAEIELLHPHPIPSRRQ